MDYDVDTIEFEGSAMHMNNALGWDSEGRLYGWGNNSDKCLGLPESQEYHKPTLVEAFNAKYKAVEAHCGRDFGMVKAIEKETGNRLIVSISNMSTPSKYGVESDHYNEDRNNFLWPLKQTINKEVPFLRTCRTHSVYYIQNENQEVPQFEVHGEKVPYQADQVFYFWKEGE